MLCFVEDSNIFDKNDFCTSFFRSCLHFKCVPERLQVLQALIKRFTLRNFCNSEMLVSLVPRWLSNFKITRAAVKT